MKLSISLRKENQWYNNRRKITYYDAYSTLLEVGITCVLKQLTEIGPIQTLQAHKQCKGS